MIHPNPAAVVAPRIAFLASRAAALLHERHAAARVHFTIVFVTVIGRAIEGLPGGSLHCEIGTATVIHPDTASVVAPGVTLLARRAAGLVRQRHAITRVGLAVMPVLVIGRAANRLRAHPRRAGQTHRTKKQNHSGNPHDLSPSGKVSRLRLRYCARGQTSNTFFDLRAPSATFPPL